MQKTAYDVRIGDWSSDVCSSDLMTDLPGAYGLDPTSPDEEVTSKVISGRFPGEAVPDVLVVVLDASNLEQPLVFAQEVLALGKPTVMLCNMEIGRGSCRGRVSKDVSFSEVAVSLKKKKTI